MRLISSLLTLTFFCNFAYSDLSNSCYTKMTQIMKPTYPRTNYQGYAVVKFDINKSGKVKNVKTISSQCAVDRDENKKIILKNCPYFKAASVAAAKYIRFKPPIDDNGNSCEIMNKTHRYKYSFYKIDGDDFVLRQDLKNKDKNKDLYMGPDLASDSFISNKYEANQGMPLDKPRE